MAHILLLAIIYMAFISLGLPDGVLGVAWPSMRPDLGQPLEAVGLITITGTACMIVSSFLAGTVVKKIGTGVLVTLSGFLTGLALLGFSWAPSFTWLLVLAVPLGLGAGAVDAGLNHFVAAHYSSRHMNWLHGCWGIGASTGPLIMGMALAGTGGWMAGYRILGSMQLTLAVLLLLTLPLWRREHATPPADAEGKTAEQGFKPVRTMALWLAPLGFLFYVAAEMGTGLWTASILVNDRHVDPVTAGVWVSAFFGSITVGRFAIGIIAARLGNRRLVRLGVVVAMCGAVLFAIPQWPSVFSLVGLVLMGLGCAPIYPSLMHETSRRFPPNVAPVVIGRQVAFAAVGGSIMPAACGLLASYVGLSVVMPVVAVLLLLLLCITEALNRMT